MRQAERILNLWIKRLTDVEVKMLQEYSAGTETPDDSDPFPGLGFTPNLDGLTGPLFKKQNGNRWTCTQPKRDPCMNIVF